MKKNEKKSFVYYNDWAELLLSLPDDRRLKIDDAIKRYVLYGEEPTDEEVLHSMFGLMRMQIDRDIAKWNGIREKRSEAGVKGAMVTNKQKLANSDKRRQKAANSAVNVNGNKNVNDNVSTNVDEKEPTNVGRETKFPFEEFWEIYGKKIGREKCEKKWALLTEEQQRQAMNHVSKYVASTPDKLYRKDPLRYLNEECWNDEIIQEHQTGYDTTSYIDDEHECNEYGW